MEDLGPDGHPKLGGVLTDLGLDRRMWASGALRFLRPLHAGKRLFDPAGLTWSVFRSFAPAVAEDPALTPDNPMMADIHQPGIGSYPVPGLAATFSALDRDRPRRAPELGADTEAVLADVAVLSGGEIAQLYDAGVVAGPRPALHPVAKPTAR